MGVTERLDTYQRRHPRASFPLAVLYKYVDDGGGHLAALLTYYAFLSLFPLLLLASTILSVVLSGDPSAQHAVLRSALSQFPVIGPQLSQPQRLSGGTVGVVVGLLGAVYGGLGVAVAGQAAMNTIWNVPKNNRPNPFKARGRAALLVVLVGIAVLLTTGLSALGGMGIGLLLIAGAVAINAVTCVMAFRITTTRHLTVRDVLPGALVAAVALEAIQLFGTAFVTHTIKHASATNSLFAVVLGLIGFLYLISLVVVLCAEANAVRVDRLYPRSLLTPLTDSVVLTSADERAYAGQAKAQRSKGFEQIDVTFAPRA